MKLKSKIFTIFLLFISTVSLAQNTKLDSLRSKLIIHVKKDTTRVNMLNNMAFESSINDVASSIKYLDESRSIADSLDFTNGKARSLFVRGDVETQQSNIDKALVYYKEALLLYEKSSNKVGVYECYAKMGLIASNKRDLDNAIKYFKNSIQVAESIGHFKETALSLKYIGYAYDDSNNFDDALLHYSKALEVNKKYHNKAEIASCLNNIGILYGAQTNNKLFALKYYNESLLVSEEIQDSLGMLKVLNNMGTIYFSNENLDRAIETYERSLVIQKNIDNDSYRGMVLNNLGNIYKKQRKFEKALLYLNEGLKKSQEINDKYAESATLNILGGVYRELEKHNIATQYFNEAIPIKIEINDEYGLMDSYVGLAHTLVNQKKYVEALVLTQKVNTLSKKFDVIAFKIDAYELFTSIYKNTSNYKKAFESQERLNILNDSLFNKKNVAKFAQLEAEYKYKQQLDSASIRELKLTKTVSAKDKDLVKSQRNYLWAIIGFLIVTLLLGGIIFYLKFRNIKSETQNIIIEQKLLRSQMTPHFIFNSLSVLQGMILNKENEKSITYLSKFSKLLRIILENSRDKSVLLSQELEAVNNYLTLQNLENKAYSYSIIVDDLLNTENIKVPAMLIQPFVENAIEHAFENQNENKKIDVYLKGSNKMIICTIIDNGVGIDMKKENSGCEKKSLATTITSERLKIVSKEYQMEGSVTIEDRKKYKEQGTIVTLVIPYKLDSAK